MLYIYLGTQHMIIQVPHAMMSNFYGNGKCDRHKKCVTYNFSLLIDTASSKTAYFLDTRRVCGVKLRFYRIRYAYNCYQTTLNLSRWLLDNDLAPVGVPRSALPPASYPIT